MLSSRFLVELETNEALIFRQTAKGLLQAVMMGSTISGTMTALPDDLLVIKASNLYKNAIVT